MGLCGIQLPNRTAGCRACAPPPALPGRGPHRSGAIVVRSTCDATPPCARPPASCPPEIPCHGPPSSSVGQWVDFRGTVATSFVNRGSCRKTLKSFTTHRTAFPVCLDSEQVKSHAWNALAASRYEFPRPWAFFFSAKMRRLGERRKRWCWPKGAGHLCNHCMHWSGVDQVAL